MGKIAFLNLRRHTSVISVSKGQLTKPGKMGVPLTADTENLEFRGYSDMQQKPQNKEETNKASLAMLLELAG